jgi:aspartate aminotransferase
MILRHLSRSLISRSKPVQNAGRSFSHWSQYEMGPPDPIVGLNEAYAEDASPNKINVGVGAYRSDDGLPSVLPCVREAEKIITNDPTLNHEYLGIVGDMQFVNHALKFVYGDESTVLSENRVAAVQTLSGTGGLRVFGELLATKGGHKHIYVPDPTWGNHIPIFTNSGLEVRKYRYYDADNSSLQFENMVKDIKDMPEGSVILLHACAHNPTGMDPTQEQWAELSKTIKDKNLLPFFDCAYQGFASGNAPQDAFAIRMFVEDGHHLATVQSFSKNFGLYGQRVGALSVIAPDETQAKNVLSQMKATIRPMYSNPPRYGAQIVKTILSDEQRTLAFIDQCKDMADRINTMRGSLRSSLEEGQQDRSWDHITKQIGMFAYSGMTKEEVIALREKHHIYCTLDGRISMAGVTSGNVDYMADAIKDVISS